jgi:hypothetical protein
MRFAPLCDFGVNWGQYEIIQQASLLSGEHCQFAGNL